MDVNNVSNQIIDGVKINTHFDKGPFFMDGVDTICSLFLQRCKQLQKKTKVNGRINYTCSRSHFR